MTYIVRIEEVEHTEEKVGVLPFVKATRTHTETREIYHQEVKYLDLTGVVLAVNNVARASPDAARAACCAELRLAE